MDSKDRIKLLKRGYSEKQIIELYNCLVGNVIIDIDWDGDMRNTTGLAIQSKFAITNIYYN